MWAGPGGLLRCGADLVLDSTRELAGHPAQGESCGAAPGPTQRVLDGEPVQVLVQGVVQRVQESVLPQLIEHQRGEDLGQAGDPAGTREASGPDRFKLLLLSGS